MLVPFSVSSSDALSHDDRKYPSNPHHLYLRQQHTVQIIQLVEGPPPPPRNITSVINDSGASSSFYSSDYSSSSEDESEDEEEAGSSYCSSDLPPEQPDMQSESDACLAGSSGTTLPTETYSAFQRILSWRENFSTHLSSTAAESSPMSFPRKRKSLPDDSDGDDMMSHTSKRSRSLSPALSSDTSAVSLDSHPCPACDASFATRQSLRQHGLDSQANEACCVAVEYSFE